MAKAITYTLGGKDREFRYTRADRDLLEDKFDMGLKELIEAKVLPSVDGRPTGGGVRKVQVALVFQGLRHHGAAVTEQRVSEWLEQEVDGQGNCFAALNAAVTAVLASGVLGFKFDPDEAEEGKDGDVPPAQ